ncbi:MAG: ABC transporter permease subunit [Bacilli bacterium]|nr:ABC transporter permease subunit [Bacilli bacterium]
MIKREFKTNFKSFIIWLSILIIIFLIVYLIYPYIITDDTMKSLDEMMKVFPPELLKAFNMDLASINSAYGWLKSEGFMFILIITGIYSSMLGSSVVLKEENDKTIEYLESLPIKRSNILTNKIIVSIIYIILMVVIFGIFNYVSLLISGDFNHREYILLSVTPLFVALPFFSINLFISTFLHKTRKTIGISLGLVFLSYVLSVLSELSTKVEFLKYFSIYTLADTRNVITNTSINSVMVIISLIITLIFILASYIRYNKKELI